MSNFHKYGAKPTTVDNVKFASKGESERYRELKLLLQQGEIRDLRLQVRIGLHTTPLMGDGQPVRVCDYIADFVYYERGMTYAEPPVVEDFKGTVTPEYAMKRKWLKLEYGITVRETRSDTRRR